MQGSRARPYRVRIGIGAFDKSEWAQVEGALAENAWYAAALLSGEMPADIEDIFAEVGLSLFPTTAQELSLDCSCPDDAVPCKHLAATFYLLAESFDDDPFAILAWRGREREDLLANLGSPPGRRVAGLPTGLNRVGGRSSTALTPISFGRPTSHGPARGWRRRRQCSINFPMSLSGCAAGHWSRSSDPPTPRWGRRR